MRDKLFIDGTWREGSGGDRIIVIDPATGDTVTEVAAGTPDDALAACDAADRAQRAWAKVAPRDRSEVLRNCWATLVEHTD